MHAQLVYKLTFILFYVYGFKLIDLLGHKNKIYNNNNSYDDKV
jgi:hypothetical protein